jgi:hypothetical protein
MNILFLRLGTGLVFILMLTVSCGKDEVQSVAPVFVFKHNINGAELQRGVMKYTNLAGNLYEVDELQYFISEIKLKTSGGQIVPIESDSAIHYVDLDIPATLAWSPTDRIPVTDYDSISFVFGINEAKNKTGLFVNPPERDMFWPDMMGGGYHYMKMNGKWKATGDIIKAFNFHIGVGMGDMGMFYQNYFTVTLPLNMNIDNSYHEFDIIMNIDKWFEAPNLWDWNVTGGQIMQNQSAMHKACENGANVFLVAHAVGLNN